MWLLNNQTDVLKHFIRPQLLQDRVLYTPLGDSSNTPSDFPTVQSSAGSPLFLACESHHRFCFELFNALKACPFQLRFQLLK